MVSNLDSFLWPTSAFCIVLTVWSLLRALASQNLDIALLQRPVEELKKVASIDILAALERAYGPLHWIDRSVPTVLFFVTPGCQSCSKLLSDCRSEVAALASRANLAFVSLNFDPAVNANFAASVGLESLTMISSFELTLQLQIDSAPYLILLNENGQLEQRFGLHRRSQIDDLALLLCNRFPNTATIRA